MADIVNNLEIFKKLGFDSTNQWMFYDERFQSFLNFFAKHITGDNILAENDVLEAEELKARGEYIENEEERQTQIKRFEHDFPGLMEHTEDDLEAIKDEVSALEEAESSYSLLIEDMHAGKKKCIADLNKIVDNTNVHINKERDLLETCLNKSRLLENLQRENSKLCMTAKQCFTKVHSPPLFMHQLPVDQYIQKCELFMQYFSLYMKEKFKVQDSLELDYTTTEVEELANKLDKMKKCISMYTMCRLKQTANAKGTQSLIDHFEVAQLPTINLTEMERKTREMEHVNEHLKITEEMLLDDLTMLVHQQAHHQMELILYVNTKEKLERALKRYESQNELKQIITNALSNAEILWIAMQLDLEKQRNQFYNTEQLNAEAKNSLQRYNLMKMRQLTPAGNNMLDLLVSQMAAELSQHLKRNLIREPKYVLTEYVKFDNQMSNTLQNVLDRHPYASVMKLVNELTHLEQCLKALIYDSSPVEMPMREHVGFLMPIYNAQMRHENMKKVLRNLRLQLKDNIMEPMDNDKFKRYSRLLWVWFLTEPRRVTLAIEEVKKAAAKKSSLGGSGKILKGIKRK